MSTVPDTDQRLDRQLRVPLSFVRPLAYRSNSHNTEPFTATDNTYRYSGEQHVAFQDKLAYRSRHRNKVKTMPSLPSLEDIALQVRRASPTTESQELVENRRIGGRDSVLLPHRLSFSNDAPPPPQRTPRVLIMNPEKILKEF